MKYEAELALSIRYLESDQAKRAFAADAYWPKWNGPWWHMLLLHEMGHTALIPDAILACCLESLDRMPLKIFPIHPGDFPAHVDPAQPFPSPCHCQLGHVYQVLSARGVDVDAALPWIRPWFLAYQMADGGLNCDEAAYLIEDECPSSMVGTIAAFEAVLLHTKRPWTLEEKAFLDKGAHFLIARELRLGSSSQYNADERISAQTWTKLCFPRFYFYDVLRGLNALTLWAEKTRCELPASAIHAVETLLVNQQSADGICIERRPLDGIKTRMREVDGSWTRQEAASFPLLEEVSAVGQPSPFLTRQWTEVKRRLGLK